MRRLALLLLPTLLLAFPARAQYWGERVLEKSFEHTGFFFEPSRLDPYGLGGFEGAAYGLVDEPLARLGLNPAYLLDDSLAAYAYLDFRGSRLVEQRPHHYWPAVYDTRWAVADIYYPHYYAEQRRALEPVVSAALLGRPLGPRSPLALGVTYQAVFQDEAYYGIPAGLYRSHVGLDYTGRGVAGAEDLPTVDRSLHEDNLRSVGHFGSAYLGLRLTSRLDVTARLAGVLFARDGARGDENLWSTSSRWTSRWQHREARRQDYGHWEAALGVNARPAPGLTVGLEGGLLDGRVEQTRTRRDTSVYAHDDVSRSLRGGRDAERWEHDGRTLYGGAHLAARLAPDRTLTAAYRLYRERVDIDLAATLRDTSYSVYSRDDPDYAYASESYFGLSDRRSGGGEREGWTHRATVAWQWQIDPRTRLSLGAGLHLHRGHTRTVEQVDAERRSYWFYESTYDGTTRTDEHFEATDEVKELQWDFRVDEVGVDVPLLLRRDVGGGVALLFGLRRTMTQRDVSDVTLAVFDYRVRTEQGETERRERFAERYSEPSERRSDVETGVLAGVTVAPARALALRLLVTPRFTDVYGDTELRQVQWWIALTARP